MDKLNWVAITERVIASLVGTIVGGLIVLLLHRMMEGR